MRVIFSLCLLFFLTGGPVIIAQGEPAFKMATNHYINGDAVIIGNNILSAHESKPHNEFSLLNDQIKMQYIDIDDRGKTFSSSSASLKIDSPTASVVSATLYWTGVYPFVKGTKRQRGEEIIYYGSGERDDTFNKVLFKPPGAEDYIKVQGNILFDGIHDDGYEDSAPYFCYADVTSLIRDSNQLNGDYMVANVKATQGYVSGGSAAGWLLFLVYESEDLKAKYVTSYHGFASINDNEVEIELRDFKTVEEGQIKASIYAAALEGDSKLYQDKMEILKPGDSTYIALSNKLRPARNFFGGIISSGDSYFSNRNPNGTNTLGFDLLEMEIPEEIFSNNQTTTKLKFSTKADRYYAFFTAFSIEINEIFQLSKTAIDHKSLDMETTQLTQEVNEDRKAEDAIPEPAEAEMTSEKNAEANDTALSAEERERIEKKMRRREMKIPGLKKGYYLITNVFSKPSYAKKWEAFVKSKGFIAETFINPNNSWLYVSAFSSEDVSEVYKTYNKLVNLEYFEEIWVFKINME